MTIVPRLRNLALVEMILPPGTWTFNLTWSKTVGTESIQSASGFLREREYKDSLTPPLGSQAHVFC